MCFGNHHLWWLGCTVGLEGLSMNFINRFQSLWQLPSPKEMAAKELEEAKRKLLSAQTGREYADAMCKFHEAQIKRLTAYVYKSEDK